MFKTKIRSLIKYLFKFFSASVVALLILSILICFYSVTPVHMDNPLGNTDYVWIPNSFWVNSTEGLSFGRLDSNGFNNRAVVDDPDILLCGSSHIEAKNVMPNKSFSHLLEEKLQGQYSLYNVGMSGHLFIKTCQYLPDNIKLYKNLKYIVIEAFDLVVTEQDVEQVMNHSVERTPSYATGVVGFLQRIPFVYTLYRQFQGGLLNKFLDKKAVADDAEEDYVATDTELDLKAYDDIFAYLKKMEINSGAQIIIFYHPFEKFDDDGNIFFEKDEFNEAFAEAALKYDIDYIDLSDAFLQEFRSNYTVPHGFVTGRIGVGHLNNNGHRIAAEKVYEIIKEKESNN